MVRKHLNLLLFVLVILLILFGYVYYIISINPTEAEPAAQSDKAAISEPEPEKEPAIKEELKTIVVEPEQKNEIVIEIKSGFLDPEDVTVPIGTTITWVNNDRRAHKLTDTKRTFYGDRIMPGETYSYTFNKAGLYNYFDVVFYSMKGTITVEEQLKPITGSAVLNVKNPRLAGISFLILLGAILVTMFGRERKSVLIPIM